MNSCAHLGETKLSPRETGAVEKMLSSIESLPEDAPVTVDYTRRGMIEQRMELSIRKVVFYKA